MFTEPNKIDIYVFITCKPPYNTGEPKCSQNSNKIDIYVFITSKPPYNTGEPKCSQNSIK